MSTRRKPPSSRPGITPAYDSLGELARIARDVLTNATASALATNDLKTIESRFDGGILLRAVEVLDATLLLVTNSHWEAASGSVRQLFEMMVNMEYLDDPNRPVGPKRKFNSLVFADRSEGVVQYLNFAIVQKLRADKERLDYRKRTGRAVDTGTLAAIVEDLNSEGFSIFRKETSSGERWWSQSWCGLTIKQLCEDSKYPHRTNEYLNSFSDWSAQAHGGPIAILESMAIDPNSDVIETRHCSHALAFAISYLIGIWMVLPAAPKPNPEKFIVWPGKVSRILARMHFDETETVLSKSTIPPLRDDGQSIRL